MMRMKGVGGDTGMLMFVFFIVCYGGGRMAVLKYIVYCFL